MYAAVLAMSLLAPGPAPSIMPITRIGPEVQTRRPRMTNWLRSVNIRGDNNTIIVYINPVDKGLYYYNNQRFVNRRPLFARFRRSYP